ncbi:MAG TPA: DUF3995 domain-containing protein [Solirubrobacteraceae bacterium]
MILGARARLFEELGRETLNLDLDAPGVTHIKCEVGESDLVSVPTIDVMTVDASTQARVASYLAAILAFTSAAVTAYWLVGGTALLSTVGGALERLATSRSAGALALAVLVVLAKGTAGAFAVALARRPSRRLATLAFAGGALLALYGAVFTVGGALVLTGVVSSSPTDAYALRWHTLVWDPWFLVWGLALATAGFSLRRTAERRALNAAAAATATRAP